MLYFNVIFVKSASFPVLPTAAVAMAMDCGEMSFAMTPPAVLAATKSAGLDPMIFAAVACMGANNVLLLTTDPVINTPIQPRIGDNSGKSFPVPATAFPKAVVSPA